MIGAAEKEKEKEGTHFSFRFLFESVSSVGLDELWTVSSLPDRFRVESRCLAIALRFSFSIAFHHPNGAQGIGGNRNAELSISTTPIYRHVISLVVFCLPAFLLSFNSLSLSMHCDDSVCKATNEISQLVHLTSSFGYLTNKVLTSAKNFQPSASNVCAAKLPDGQLFPLLTLPMSCFQFHVSLP